MGASSNTIWERTHQTTFVDDMDTVLFVCFICLFVLFACLFSFLSRCEASRMSRWKIDLTEPMEHLSVRDGGASSIHPESFVGYNPKPTLNHLYFGFQRY